MKWEYRDFMFHTDHSINKLIDQRAKFIAELNEIGKEGWMVVNIFSWVDPPDNYQEHARVLCMRPRPLMGPGSE